MDAESIAGLVGLCVGLLVLLALTVYEWHSYKREHGEGMVHHWLTEHHMLGWHRTKH